MKLPRLFSRLICLLLILMLLPTVQPAYGAPQTVKIGFFPMPGFQEYDEYGHPCGYNVDYLEKIAALTGWEYEYVRLSSWDEALAALEEGRIDLVGSAQMTAERYQRFKYSNYIAGFTFASLLAPKANTEIAFEDFDLFGRLRIGCVKTYVRLDDFLKYADENDFTPHITYYDSTSEMREAMRAGEIDLMVCSVMEMSDSEQVVARFAHAPFYYITCPGREDLIDELDSAMAALKLDDPNLEDRLFNKYYPGSTYAHFTREELDYIQSAPTVRIAHLTNRSPISYLDGDSKITGVSPDLVRWIEKDSGLKFQDVPIAVGGSPLDVLNSNHADLVAGMLYSEANLQNRDLALSSPYFESSLIFLGKRGTPFSPSLRLRVAVPAGFQAAEKYVSQAYPLFDLVSYVGTENCLDAVNSGDVDLTIQNRYVVDELLLRQRYGELTAIPDTDVPEKLCFGGQAGIDPLLISILNKSISHLTPDVTDHILVGYTSGKVYHPSLEDFIMAYKAPIAAVTLCFLLLLLSGAYIIVQRRRYYRDIQLSEKRLQSITNNINGGVVTTTPDNRMEIRYANPGFLDLIGINDPKDLENKSFQALISSEDRERTFPDCRLNSSRQISLELSIQHADGHFVPVLLRGTLSPDEKGNNLLYCVIIDISQQKRMIQMLEEEEKRSAMLIELSDSVFFDVTMPGHVVRTSPMFYRKFGWDLPSGNSYRRILEEHIHPEDRIAKESWNFIQRKERNSHHDLRVLKADGTYIWCRFTLGYFYENNKISRLVGKIEDIDTDVKKRQLLEAASSRDGLTGLYNRKSFRTQAEQYLSASACRPGSCAALFFLDLDNFKAVNDTLGHSVGDQALIDTAKALQSVFRRDDIIGRFGGDEFYVFAPSLPQTLAEQKAVKLCELSRRTYTGPCGEEVSISASIGIACFPSDGRILDDLIEHADQAAYLSKRSGKGRYTFFQES
ncbi:diguanylate cyclase [Clostridium sp. AM58-1XD]|uniref:diguanylate cyclase n=1 Tax=Clostridium sp. AM58-1XD TaxID=2292307 RepID=UPI0015F36EE5|nr:diguanylate cyclase [Clostridium sp. AM58-1XD]